ncbi:MAG: hypothetical protein H5T74_14080 [Actinobacteria bacterium]|nr:hypothetical protein [Actinomycetota bacterium]MDI6831180.1 hypothetical protein [Actinomycetota bacterium]
MSSWRSSRFSRPRTSNERVKRLWYPAYVTLCLVLVLFFTLPAVVLTNGDQLQNEWKPLAERVVEVSEEMGSGKPYLASPYYFAPAEIAYYAKDALAGYTVAFLVYEHSVLGSGGSKYAPWIPVDSVVGEDLVFVDCETNPDNFDTPIAYWERKLPAYFEHVDPPETFSYTKRGKDVRDFYIFKCYGFKGSDGEMDRRGEVRDFVDGKISRAPGAGRSLSRLP